VTAPTSTASASRSLGHGACFGIGAGAALLGLLPWAVTGMRLPLQNLWATSGTDMPIAFLPFSQYAVTALFGILVTGSAVGGLVARATRHRQPRFGFLTTLAAIVALQAAATIQTAIVVSGGLVRSDFAALYLAGLVGGVVFSILVGALVAWLLAKAPPAGAIVGASVAGVALSFWVGALLSPLGSVGSPPLWLLGASRWIPAIVVGAAIAVWGVASIGRAAAAVFGLLVLWLAPALATGASSALGMRVFASDPAQMLDYGWGVTRMALFLPELALPPILVAVIVALFGLGARTVVLRRGRPG
jgi:hypothetical protein